MKDYMYYIHAHNFLLIILSSMTDVLIYFKNNRSNYILAIYSKTRKEIHSYVLATTPLIKTQFPCNNIA